MYLQTLDILNFRNHEKSSLNFSPGINLIIGKNGQGKTNLLEAIYVLFNGKSYKCSLNNILITSGEEITVVKGSLVGREKKEDIGVMLKINEQKNIKINGIQNQRVKDLRNIVNIVLFSPEDLKIVKGGPGERRDFIDEVGEQINYKYNHLKWKFLRILKQRNNLLRQVAGKGWGKEELKLWDDKLVLVGSKFISARNEVVEKLKPYCHKINLKINSKKNLKIKYLNDLINNGDVEGDFYRKIKKLKDYEIERGSTLVGPHRDDVGLYLNDADVRLYGSQGEQRVVSLCLKMAELELIKEEKKKTPILLMDDVMSELDEEMRDNLLRFILNLKQSIITSTNFSYFNQEHMNKINLIEVCGGGIKERACLKI